MNEMIDDIIKKNSLKTLKTGLSLTEGQIALLQRYNIEFENAKTLTDVLFSINTFLNNTELDDEEYEEIEDISLEIAERNYYNNTTK